MRKKSAPVPPARWTNQWKKLGKDCKILYSAYGGWKNLLWSPYFHISGLLSLTVTICGKYFRNRWEWYDIPLTALPNVVGFSLAAYAIVLTFGSDRFQDAIRGAYEPEKSSPYLKLSASFAHFVLVQIGALLFAVLGSSLEADSLLVSLIGSWLFIYSLGLGAAAALAVFFLSQMYDRMPKDK